MNKNLTDITLLLDRSGSMSSIASDTVGGINSFLRKQRELPGECSFTLYQFDHEFEKKISTKPIKEVKDLTNDDFVPRGMTALLDAIDQSIDETGERLANLPEGSRPGNVLFVILTDGLENASKRWGKKSVPEKIQYQTSKYNWNFIYLGANQDAFAVGSSYGMQKGFTSNYEATSDGIRFACATMGNSATSLRSGGSAAISE